MSQDSALERITLVENHEQCVQASIVVEAIFEELEAKRSLFAGLVRASASLFVSWPSLLRPGRLFVSSGEEECEEQFVIPMVRNMPTHILHNNSSRCCRNKDRRGPSAGQ